MAVAQIVKQFSQLIKNVNIYDCIHKRRPALLVRTLNHFNPLKITISCLLPFTFHRTLKQSLPLAFTN